jgi:histidinol-phosphate aminotransferase
MSSAPRPRAALDALPVYKPGKAAEVAMAEHDLDSAVKLASNENPFDPLPSVLEAIQAAAGRGLPRYADHRAVAVREALAAKLGVPVESVTVGCGSVGLLQQLLLTYVDPGEAVVYGWRSFEAYPIYAATVGAKAVPVPNRFEALDMAAITEAAVRERARLVLVTSPNNPTGTAVAADELVALLEAVGPDTLVVLDEAYYEYLTGRHVPDALALQRAHRQLAVLRTFSKAYGLAALRIGYLIADPDVVGAVDKTLVPFAVNGLAQAAALASLEAGAEGELFERVRLTLSERDRIERTIRGRLRISLPDPQANFVWLPAGERAVDLTLALERAGVVTRPFPGEGVRVTIGAPHENDRFLDAFERAATELDLAATWLLPVGDDALAVHAALERIDGLRQRVGVAGATALGAAGDGFTRLRRAVEGPAASGAPRAGATDGQVLLDAVAAYVPGLGSAEWRCTASHPDHGDLDVAAHLDRLVLAPLEAAVSPTGAAGA